VKRTQIAILGLLLLAALLVAGTCLSANKPAQSISIAWNYDTSGYLETCGCSAKQLGGLARRATKLEQLRAAGPVLAIEGAHVVEDRGEFQLFKAQMIVEALNLMDYGAMMVGVREAQHGTEGLGKLVAGAKFPVFSANMQAADAPWLKRYATVEIGGTQVAITGVSQPELVNFELGAGITFSDADAALKEVLPEMRKADLQVICLEGHPEWLDQMTARHRSSADLFLSGNRQEGADLEFHADPPRINSFDRGRYMGLVTADRTPSGFNFSGLNLPLSDDLDNGEAVQKLLDETYKPQLKDKFFEIFKGTLPQLFMPPEYCGDCHPKELEIYNTTLHSHALETLEKKSQTYNPDCMKCHVTYDPSEDKLHSMNCVTCHTNITEDHVWQATTDPKTVVKPETPVTTYTYEWCYQCHDPLNSANFEAHWPQYINKIYHGGDMSAAIKAAEAMGIDYKQPPPAHE
jgi:hypothetical protein